VDDSEFSKKESVGHRKSTGENSSEKKSGENSSESTDISAPGKKKGRASVLKVFKDSATDVVHTITGADSEETDEETDEAATTPREVETSTSGGSGRAKERSNWPGTRRRPRSKAGKQFVTSVDGETRPKKELTDAQLAEIKEAFSIFDENGSGSISKEEIIAVLTKIERPPTEEEVNRLMEEANKSKTGQLTYPEFLVMMRNQLIIDEEEDEVRSVFQIFDPKNTGYINGLEFKRALTSIGDVMSEQEIQEILAVLDRDSSGKIELKKLVAELCK